MRAQDPSMQQSPSHAASRPSSVQKSRRALSAIFPSGKEATVDLIINGCYVEKVGDPMNRSHADKSKRKATKVRSESAGGSLSTDQVDGTAETRNKSTRNGSSAPHYDKEGASQPRNENHLDGSPSKDGKFVQNILGDDGNQYYCDLCLDVGDVVCCDGCPKVYHPRCIPIGCESRKSMDAEEDPWYCPHCMDSGRIRSTSGKKKGRASSRSAVLDRSKASHSPQLHGVENQSEVVNGSSQKLSPVEKLKPERSGVDDVDAKQQSIAFGDEEIVQDCTEEYSPYESQLSRTETGIVRAVQPFFYYLWDNRIRIERQLGRKNRLFKRALKGYERNLMLAKEGLYWWNKASGQERRRYLEYSMKEFEETVISWKEEEIIKEMYELADKPVEIQQEAFVGSDISPDDEKYWKKKSKSLISWSRIECNRSKPQQNTILMELLQDTRFHPLPMMTPNREPSNFENPDYSKMVVPHFSVQGPVATCVGDQCIGCTRGWNHFCPILGRQFPAVEYRAKLQPPYPSYLATRIGFGLVAEDEMAESKVQIEGSKRYRDVQTLGLPDPCSRSDDVMDFVEKLVAVKMTTADASSPGNHDSLATETRNKWKSGGVDDAKEKAYVCGKCKSTIKNSEGCISCRRAQLLVYATKQEENEEHGSSSKVQTAMLSRAHVKMDDFDKQSEIDKALAKALTTKHWKPNAVLPPIAKSFPQHNPSPESDSEPTDAPSSASEGDESSHSSVDDKYPHDYASPTKSSANIDEYEKTPKKMKPSRRLSRRGNTPCDSDESEATRRARELAYKEDSVQLQEKCLSLATCGILLGLIRRDPLRLFAEPVPITVESYHNIIKDPIDFSRIKAKVLSGEYNTLGAFASDIKLLYMNSLIYNPAGTIYSITANELKNAFDLMQKRASDWMTAIKNAHASFYARKGRTGQQNGISGKKRTIHEYDDQKDDDPFFELRRSWPAAIDLLEERISWMKTQLSAEFVRTKENECAYYGALAIRRSAAAAEASLAPFYDHEKIFQPCIRRNHADDELLRDHIDKNVARASDLSKLQHYPSWREGDVLGLMKKVQKWRVDKQTSPHGLCGRCVSSQIHGEAKLARYAESQRKRRKLDEVQIRVAESRKIQSTGMASKKERERVAALDKEKQTRGQTSVTVRGSQIQGWGLYADHSFQKGEVVAEYVGEYVVNPVTDRREKIYTEGRIQDYQFRVSANLVIDATKHGGFARYINHSCDPNCVAKIVDVEAPNQHLKRVIVSSQRAIEAGDEITYDYQFPIELDLDARLPCSCGAKNCRGFMNWDLPESTSMILRARTSRGRKERIRNLVRKDMKRKKV